MKKISFLVLLTGLSILKAQVIIGDQIGTVPPGAKSSVLLEFAAGQNKGIILPYVRILPQSHALVGGSLVLDATDATKARVKYYNGTSWIDLSGQDADLTTPVNYMGVQPSVAQTPEILASKAIIGDVPNPIPANFPDGVLVLNSTTKAMVLPQVAQTSDIPNPSPGMMVYIVKTGSKRLAVFNGSKWSYWMP